MDNRLSFHAIIKSIDAASDKQIKKLGRIEGLLQKQYVINAKTTVEMPVIEKIFDQQQPIKPVASDFVKKPRNKNKPKSSDSEAVESQSESISSTNLSKQDIMSESSFEQDDTDKDQLDATAKTNELLEGLWLDAKGLLRQQNGAFASKKQKEQFDKDKSDADNKGDDESKLKKLFSSVSDWVAGSNTQDAVTDVAGKSVGGSYWSAAIELKDLAVGVKEKIDDNGLGSREAIKETVSAKAKGAKDFILSLFGLGKTKQVTENHDENKTSTSDTSVINNKKVETSESSVTSEARLDMADNSSTSDNDEYLEAMVSWQGKTVKSIDELKDELKNVGGAGGDSMLDDLDLFGGKNKKGGSKRKLGKGRFAKPMSSVMNGAKNAAGAVKSAAGSILGKIAVPLTALVAGVSRYNEVKDKKDLTTSQKAVQVGATTTGAVGGTLSGMAAGAALGSVIPVVGTLIGGLLGAAVGGWLGTKGGDVVGEAITTNFMDSPENIADVPAGNDVSTAIADSQVNNEANNTTKKNSTVSEQASNSIHVPDKERFGANDNTMIKADNSQPIVVTNSDPKLTKAINELSKSVKGSETNKGRSGRDKQTIITQHKSSGKQIPTEFEDTTLKLIAMDID